MAREGLSQKFICEQRPEGSESGKDIRERNCLDRGGPEVGDVLAISEA